MDTRPSSRQQHQRPSSPAFPPSAQASMLPQYGFGATYTFDALVQQHHFLYRVHTPKNKTKAGSSSLTLSRSTSPSRAPSIAFSLTSSPRPLSRSLYSTPNRPGLSRSPSSLSTSLSASVSSIRSDASDYFGFGNVSTESSTLIFAEGKNEDEEDTAPNDPYFLSRRFKDELSSPDVHQRRRTLSTLSTLSGGSGVYTHMATDDEGESRLSRSLSVNLGPHTRMHSTSPGRPDTRRSVSTSAEIPSQQRRQQQQQQQQQKEGSISGISSHRAEASDAAKLENETVANQPNAMTYDDLVRHLDWTTRSSSPYVTTSFSFFWCVWEAVRRYKLGVKHDVEIAVIDARRVQGRARTALEVLRSTDDKQQDKAYWKWYRFALESQDVLVFGAIPGDAIYTSVPLTSLLSRLPSYFFNAGGGNNSDIPRGPSMIEDLREEDPREPDPLSMEDFEVKSIVKEVPDSSSDVSFPTTPAHPRKRTVSSSSRLSQSLSRDIISLQERSFAFSKEREWEEEKRRDEERTQTRKLLAALAWDVGTTLKPPKKTKNEKEGERGRHTSHRDFCAALQKSFLAKTTDSAEPGSGRSEDDRMKDATDGAVKLAETLIEPWFRARCTMASAQASYPFRHGDSDSESEDEENDPDSGCLGLSGDGCSLHSHSKHRSLSSSMTSSGRIEKEEDDDDDDDDEEEEEPELEVAKRTLIALACELSRWPAGWWYDEHRDTVESGITKAVETCAHDAASGASERFGKGVERFEWERRNRTISMGSVRSLGSLGKRGSSFWEANPGERRARTVSYAEPRGRELSRSRSRSRARSPLVRHASEGSPLPSGGSTTNSSSPKPWPTRRSPSSIIDGYKPRARSPLGMTPALGPAIVLQPRDTNSRDRESRERSRSRREERLSDEQAWEPTTPPPTPPLTSVDATQKRRSPPPPPPRSSKRSSSPRSSSPASSPPEGDVFSPPTQPQLLSTPPHSRNPSQSSSSTLVEDLGLVTPLSLGVAASSVMGMRSTASSPASLAGSRKSSSESLSSALGFGNGSNVTPSPSPLRNQTRRSSGQSMNDMALLTEVVNSAFGLGANGLAGAAMQELRLDTSSINSSPSFSDKLDKQDRAHALTHHRRHSMQSIVQESELSPVREDAQEEDEAELASLEEERRKKEEGKDLQEKTSRESLKAVCSDDTQADGSSMPGAYINTETGTSTPISDMMRSRSATLASIPEDKEEWMLMDAPNSASASMYGSVSGSIDDSTSLGRTLEEELPKEPVLEPTVLEDDVNVPALPLDGEARSALKTCESLDSLSSEYYSHEIYEPRGRAIQNVGPGLETKYRSVEVATDPINESLSVVVPAAESVKTVPVSTPHSIIKTLCKSRAFFRTLLVLPILNYFRPFVPPPSTSTSGTSTPARSPVFEDDEPSSGSSSVFSYIKSRLRRLLRSTMSQKTNEQSRSLILGPRPAWDSPILDERGLAYGTRSSLAERRRAGMVDDSFYSSSRTSSWAMSCFVCGIMATLALASIHQRREALMLVGNRLT